MKHRDQDGGGNGGLLVPRRTGRALGTGSDPGRRLTRSFGLRALLSLFRLVSSRQVSSHLVSPTTSDLTRTQAD